MSGFRTAVPFFAFAILLVRPVEATTSYYQRASGETTFNASIGGLTLLDPSLTFSASDLGSFGLYNASGTGIDFLGFDDFFFNTPTDFAVVSGKLDATQAGQVTKIVFPAAGVYAFGFHITVSANSTNWCISLTSGGCDSAVFISSPASPQFFGFVSDTPVIASLYIRPQSGSPFMVMKDFEAYSVPEPHTLLLVGLGLVISSLVRRKARWA